MRNSDADSSQRMLNAIEPGAVVATYDLAAGGPICALNIPADNVHLVLCEESVDGAGEPSPSEDDGVFG